MKFFFAQSLRSGRFLFYLESMTTQPPRRWFLQRNVQVSGRWDGKWWRVCWTLITFIERFPPPIPENMYALSAVDGKRGTKLCCKLTQFPAHFMGTALFLWRVHTNELEVRHPRARHPWPYEPTDARHPHSPHVLKTIICESACRHLGLSYVMLIFIPPFSFLQRPLLL